MEGDHVGSVANCLVLSPALRLFVVRVNEDEVDGLQPIDNRIEIDRECIDPGELNVWIDRFVLDHRRAWNDIHCDGKLKRLESIKNLNRGHKGTPVPNTDFQVRADV